MANDLYWQESLSQWDWSRLTSFLADEIPEGRHLEYKEPSRKQNGKWDITYELVETIVAMANTDDGLLIIGDALIWRGMRAVHVMRRCASQ